MRYLKIRNIVFVLALSLIGFACSDSSSSTGSGSEPATVSGRVENNSSQKAVSGDHTSAVEGAVVTAARVSANGDLETIGDTEATTDAEGKFTLEIDGEALANADASDKVVIVANKGDSTAKAFVTSKVESGSSVKVQPITFESSAEADVYQNVVANDDAEMVTKADIEVSVDAEAATNINSSSDMAAEMASALAAKAEAKADYYSEQSIEITQDQKDQIAQTKTDAQIQLESSLDAASSNSEKEAAWNTFIETVAKAELDADVNADAVAKSSEASSRVLVKNCADFSSEAKSEIRKSTSYMLSFAIDAAVQAQLGAAEASDNTISAASDAAADLKADIKAQTNATAEAMDSTYANFNNDISTAIENDTSIEGSAFVTVNDSLNESNGPKATLESALEATLDLNVMMDAYTDFHSSVKAMVDSNFSEATDAQAEAYTELLILINLAS